MPGCKFRQQRSGTCGMTVQADSIDVTLASKCTDAGTLLGHCKASQTPLTSCISPGDAQRRQGCSFVESVVLESKDVDCALVGGAAKPLVPTAEVDAVDSRLISSSSQLNQLHPSCSVPYSNQGPLCACSRHHSPLLGHCQADKLILVCIDRHWSAAHSLLRCVKVNQLDAARFEAREDHHLPLSVPHRAHLTKAQRVVPRLEGEKLGWRVGKGEHVDLVPRHYHNLVPLHPHSKDRGGAGELENHLLRRIVKDHHRVVGELRFPAASHHGHQVGPVQHLRHHQAAHLVLSVVCFLSDGLEVEHPKTILKCAGESSFVLVEPHALQASPGFSKPQPGVGHFCASTPTTSLRSHGDLNSAQKICFSLVE